MASGDLGRAPSAGAHAVDVHGRVPASGLALAFRSHDDPVGCEIAILPAGAVSRELVCARRMAVVVSQRLCWLAADFRSTVALVLPASRVAGNRQSRGQPARL